MHFLTIDRGRRWPGRYIWPISPPGRRITVVAANHSRGDKAEPGRIPPAAVSCLGSIQGFRSISNVSRRTKSSRQLQDEGRKDITAPDTRGKATHRCALQNNYALWRIAERDAAFCLVRDGNECTAVMHGDTRWADAVLRRRCC
ncbi:hypothetical protein E2C01_083514 [Portunus trituberculatus]|uniref:Uncharacterized protein n=1 Tax=Portunus trituberculatus TaxID=210409 RepID=A0A5B7J1Z3_PORTR|nr:hypothetical protein [Portunus trituberculatus]